VGLAIRAVFREAWLVAPGLALAILRRLLSMPAHAFVWAIVLRAALLGMRERPLDPVAPLAGALAAVTSPRFLAIAAGLALASALASAALRILFVAGAAPVLAARMAGAPVGAAGFASGAVWGLPAVLATAALGFVAEVAAGGFGLALVLGVVSVSLSAPAPLVAIPVALALTLAFAVPVAISAVVDAAVARAGVTGEGPLAAFAAATRRFVSRPGAFLLGALAFAFAGALAPAAVEALGNGFTALAPTRPELLVGPGLMLAALAAAIAAVVDLAWLGTVSVLACGEDRGG
jgi:hypothetical protein